MLKTVGNPSTRYGDQTIVDGNLIIGAAGKGIDFTANGGDVLTHYDEGTWTPVVGGSASYSGQSGSYIRVGNLVTLHFDLQIDVIGTGSTTEIGGLPFINGPKTAAGSIGYFVSLATNVVFLAMRVDGAASTLTFTGLTAAGSGVPGALAVFGNSSRVIGSITYSLV